MKNILLAVTGLSPQVITETLYALHKNHRHVDEIHIITTRTGKERIYARLLGGQQGYFYKYLEEYRIQKDSILFDHSNIHVIADENSNELEDISDIHANEILLKKCLDLTFEFTRDSNTSVFFSVAGGRKTMSSCLTLAAQLYGRPQDRLYHVLVSPEFENNPDFFYPPVKSRKIKLMDSKGQPYYKETKFARITLINIPFVSIRPYLSSDQLKEPKDPGTLMLSLVREKTPSLVVNLPEKKILYKNIELDLMPAPMALYAFFARQKKECTKDRDRCMNCRDCFMDADSVTDNADAIAQIYKKICGSRPTEEMKGSGIINLDKDNFRSLRTRINKKITDTFGKSAADSFGITATGARPSTEYGISMDKTRIKMII